MNISRRTFFAASTGLCGLVLAGCATSATGGTIPAQLLNDVNAGITTGLSTVALLAATMPPDLTAAQASAITTALQKAQAAVAGLTPATLALAGAPTMQSIDGFINTALSDLAALPVIPAPFNVAVDALALVAPEIEAFVATALGTVSASAPKPWQAKFGAVNGMTLARARQVLGAAVVQ